jgi:exopolysaccharide biosynthesis protein
MRTILLLAFLITRAAADWTPAGCDTLPSPAGLEFMRVRGALDGESVELHVVRFNPKTHTFTVMDDPAKIFDIATAAQKRGALAAVNGGYFHPDRTPLGLVVRQGVALHGLEHAGLLSGLVVATRERVALLRVGEFKSSAAVREALQAGPFLVDGGKAVAGLNAERRAERTFVFTQGAERCGLGVCSAVTLAEMGRILAAPGIVPGGKITRALNLDGGSSTGLWVAGDPAFYRREGKDVRNFLGIIAR